MFANHKAKRHDITFPGGWLVPFDQLEKYIADYMQNKPENGDAYRYRWLVQHDVFKSRQIRKDHPLEQAREPATPPNREPVLKLVWDRIPHKPYCTDNLEQGIRIRPKSQAIRRRFLQPNPPSNIWTLVFDIDRAGGADAWRDAELPPPTFPVSNPASGHGQIWYGLKSPVCCTDVARQKPLKYLSAIQNALTIRLGADRAYAGNIARNPLHQDHLIPDSWDFPLYDLGELASYLNLKQSHVRTANTEIFGLGRNCAMFDEVRKWSYSTVREYRQRMFDDWHRAVLNKCNEVNGGFGVPLPFSELKATAKSIAKWVREKDKDKERAFRERQSWRAGRNTSAAQSTKALARAASCRQATEPQRVMAVLMRSQGHPYRSIAANLGVSVGLVHRWCHESDDQN